MATTRVLEIARLGYAARGIMYVLLSVLAMLAATGATNQVADRFGALQRLSELPFGGALLLAIALGLVDYAMWSFIRAVFDPERRQGMTGWVQRSGNVLGGLAYIGLAGAAFAVAAGGSGGMDSSELWLRTLAVRGERVPFGSLCVAAIGLMFIATAVAQAYEVISADFMAHLDTYRLGRTQGRNIRWLGRVGIAARGVVLAILGSLFIQTGLVHSSSVGLGIGGALQTIALMPRGDLLLGIVATGLCIFGIFSLTEARYHRLRVS